MPGPQSPRNAQLSIPGLSQLDDVLAQLAASGAEERGAVYTRREVVDFILDLSGYTSDRALHALRLLEPAFGGCDFLLPALDRLFAAYDRAGRPGPAVEVLRDCIRAVELHQASHTEGLRTVETYLAAQGLAESDCKALAAAWLTQGDFLLLDTLPNFTHIVGNPPYVRQEAVPAVLMAEYRRRYRTIYDRADLYVPFIERALSLLAPDGRLGFICADRWMKNRYGGPLRQLVAEHFHLQVYVDMVDTPAFHTDVIAYPAITIIGRENAGPTRIARRPAIDVSSLQRLAAQLTQADVPSGEIRELADVATGSQPWIFDTAAPLDLVRRLEAAFPTLEEAGCRVGIGVATGADKAFIGRYDELDVEPDRKLPLAMTRDIQHGSVSWLGLGVINPFAENGRLVDLACYPRLRAYLEAHREQIAGRHVARKAPTNWYRTIDRIYPELARQPKLLIPDIKGEAHIVYEDEGLYPHHNLYFITSDSWDLRALQAVLTSGLARLFVATYSTRMRGGYLRFQAQYLRRIRVPHWDAVPEELKAALVAAAACGDKEACDAATFALFQLTPDEQALLSAKEAAAS